MRLPLPVHPLRCGVPAVLAGGLAFPGRPIHFTGKDIHEILAIATRPTVGALVLGIA